MDSSTEAMKTRKHRHKGRIMNRKITKNTTLKATKCYMSSNLCEHINHTKQCVSPDCVMPLRGSLTCISALLVSIRVWKCRQMSSLFQEVQHPLRMCLQPPKTEIKHSGFNCIPLPKISQIRPLIMSC